MSYTIYHYTNDRVFSPEVVTLCGAAGNPPGGTYNCVEVANPSEDHLKDLARWERQGLVCTECTSIRPFKTLGEATL
jgi:hypothetical protein